MRGDDRPGLVVRLDLRLTLVHTRWLPRLEARSSLLCLLGFNREFKWWSADYSWDLFNLSMMNPWWFDGGAATTCYVALHPQVQGVTGIYFVDSNVSEVKSHVADPEMAKKFWEISLNMIN
ncbi:hypothetical protein J5N97_024283 [Dioscorea zingiberensis]|uniref:Uncharacterized protein n=1 Tax=Dioscorea zingiberensis TaxID=325984 RepID=A0A9D5H8L4_9LILI|nr:hypothetical protein J5N97_024283 [Dioscorea zingiberensis]